MSIPVANRIVRHADGETSCPECGCLLSDTRSNDHLRAFFGFMRFCFDNWPESHAEFQPDNPEHLRAWLLVASNHQEPIHVFRFATKKEMRIAVGFIEEQMRADRACGRYGWPDQVDGGIAIRRPASIAFDKISEKKFVSITKEVFAVIHERTGISFDLWKENQMQNVRAA